jgi:hypothetical protein
MIDNMSEPGAWVREWDARPHTVPEYQQEIREMRERIRAYLERIGQLEAELNEERAKNNEWVREP